MAQREMQVQCMFLLLNIPSWVTNITKCGQILCLFHISCALFRLNDFYNVQRNVQYWHAIFRERGKKKIKNNGPIISLYYCMIIASLCMYLHWNWIASRSSRIFMTICIMWPIVKLPTSVLIRNPVATQNLSILYINSYYPVCLQWQ